MIGKAEKKFILVPKNFIIQKLLFMVKMRKIFHTHTHTHTQNNTRRPCDDNNNNNNLK